MLTSQALPTQPRSFTELTEFVERDAAIGLPEALLTEFRQSAIPDRLITANIEWIEGDAAIELLSEHAIAESQRVNSYVGVQARRILNKYAFASLGGWVSTGCTINGAPATVPYFKPTSPRQAKEFLGFGQAPKVKTVKYETPQGLQATPILPWVDDETAQAIYERYQVTPLDGETFWTTVRRCNLPIALTEGLKKALCLIAHGIPAIALRGICNWHPKGELDLHPEIAHFAAANRSIYIVFDQDEKLTTQKAVRTQILKLGEALKKQGAAVHVCIWDSQRGKGIDEAVFAGGTHAAAWLAAVFEDALDLKTYQRDAWILKAIDLIARLNTLTYPVERTTEGEYLPALPPVEQGTIHVIDASMNSGKTVRIGADWVKAAISFGWNCLVLTPINNLGKQAAHDWQLPHIHGYGTKSAEQSALWADVSHSHGIVLCPDSLHRLPDWFWNRPTLLILDEANQVIQHLCEGDTLGSRYSLILEKFTAAARHAIATGAIVLSEDGLPNRAIDFAKLISACDSVRVFQHRKQGTPWDCCVFAGQASGYRSRFFQAVEQNKRLLFVTSSQHEAERLAWALLRTHPEKTVVRIDSTTNQEGQFTAFFEQPDAWLKTHQPDILILSPSAKSGVSIEGGLLIEDAYFDAVWGYFSALATDTHWQLLGRYRPAVPRFIFVPDFIVSSSDESLLNSRAIQRRLHLNSNLIAGVYNLGHLLNEDNCSELQGTIETAVLQYLTVSRAVSGIQKSIASMALIDRLKKAGHPCRCERLAKDAVMIELWKTVREELWQEQAFDLAATKVEPDHTKEWALKKLDGLEVSLDMRRLAQKVLWREEFPGVTFDDPEECYQALCKENGAMRRGVLLQARAENLEATKESERKAVEAVLNGNVRALHRLPKAYAKSLLIAKSGVLELLDGEIYSNADERCQRVRTWALHFQKEILYWLGLHVAKDHTPIEICHRLLKRLGFERHRRDRPGAVKLIDRLGKRGENVERFAIDLDFNPVRTRLLEAAQRKLQASVTSIRKLDQTSNHEINVTNSETSPEPIEALVREQVGSLSHVAESPETGSSRLIAAFEPSRSGDVTDQVA
ncbi:MAG: DUF3854 domain-containing protein [Phormidium tanganyikae FI6-MK23]|jgi:hypothetical protein|nr:DUF3854 domain-containing protein [Phormidium tanganyikae FI6-MK23]